jgi:K+-transporting ATPase ATPase C chain
LREIVSDHTEERTMGLFGEPHVNVLGLNLAVDAEKPQ